MATAALTQADLVALFRRVVPAAYAEGVLGGPGRSAIEALAAQFARVSGAVAESLDRQAHILTASIGARAQGAVTLTRTIAGVDGTVSAGTRLRSASGLSFVTTADAFFGPLVTELTVTAEASEASYAGNVRAGEIDRVALLLGPPGQDSATVLGTVTVTNALAFSGGKSPVLVLQARNRGLSPQANETEDEFRARIRRLLDTVTVPNVQDAGNRALRAGGKQGFVSEPFELFGPDGPQPTILDSDYLDDFAGSVVYHQELLLGDGQARGSFFFHVPLFPTSVPEAFLDGQAFFDAGTHLDVEDLVVRGLYAALIRAVEATKAAGVNVVYLIDPNL